MTKVTINYDKLSKSKDTKYADPLYGPGSYRENKDHKDHHMKALKSAGVSAQHAAAIHAHANHDDLQNSNKNGYDTMSKHNGLTVHSKTTGDEDGGGGKSSYMVEEQETVEINPVESLVDSILDGDAVNSKDQFENLMGDRINDYIDASKEVISSNLFNDPSEIEDQGVEEVEQVEEGNDAMDRINDSLADRHSDLENSKHFNHPNVQKHVKKLQGLTKTDYEEADEHLRNAENENDKLHGRKPGNRRSFTPGDPD